ncbi:hypothetical protein GDO86_011367 [Hymenochirus boettgeri]|uniref:Muscle-restricted coiled-coil protein n=1 Tax=Hymenochirus boettgeri TaxID=247094 RepID=A0A8T2JG60_9PIPI|nr:hypothetical protein GDO86_011367 [Hymenochirus boettgeri]
MDHELSSEIDRVNLNRLSVVSEDEEDHDAALTIVTVLDKVATIVDTVNASQKRIEERHREMENAIKTIQIDLLKLSQAHSNTSYTVNKLLEKTRKVSTNVKDVKSRVDKQADQVQKVESKQEEMLRKNKFRVVIFQEDIECPTKLTVAKDDALDRNIYPPDDLSSDEEYTVEESRTSRLKKSGKQQIDNIKKAFSKENMQKTKQNFGKKVNRIRTRIVTPERRERIRQSGERLKQSGERFKQSIAKAAPKKDSFKISTKKKGKQRTTAEGQEEGKEDRGNSASEAGTVNPISEDITYTEVVTVKKKKKKNEENTELLSSQDDDKLTPEPEKPLLKVESNEMPLININLSSS